MSKSQSHRILNTDTKTRGERKNLPCDEPPYRVFSYTNDDRIVDYTPKDYDVSFQKEELEDEAGDPFVSLIRSLDPLVLEEKRRIYKIKNDAWDKIPYASIFLFKCPFCDCRGTKEKYRSAFYSSMSPEISPLVNKMFQDDSYSLKWRNGFYIMIMKKKISEQPKIIVVDHDDASGETVSGGGMPCPWYFWFPKKDGTPLENENPYVDAFRNFLRINLRKGYEGRPKNEDKKIQNYNNFSYLYSSANMKLSLTNNKDTKYFDGIIEFIQNIASDKLYTLSEMKHMNAISEEYSLSRWNEMMKKKKRDKSNA
jgi:hypothetical protein